METWKIPSTKLFNVDDYEILHTVGAGTFARVRLVKNASGNYYALKMMKKVEVVRLKQTDHVTSEIRVSISLDYPLVAKLHGFQQDDKYLYLLQDYIPGGELYTYLKSQKKLSINSAAFYAGQIVLMLNYLHSKSIIYRDLKPENLLISSTGYLRLVDFGLAKFLKSRTFTHCGTPEYMAPEILLNKGYNHSVDWWALGILLYEMISGTDPFVDDDPMQIYSKILKGKMKFVRGTDKDAKNLIKHFLVADINIRYGCTKNGIEDIKSHISFEGFDFQKLEEGKLQPPYIPPSMYNSLIINRDPEDNPNCLDYPDSDNEPPSLKSSEDPFANW